MESTTCILPSMPCPRHHLFSSSSSSSSFFPCLLPTSSIPSFMGVSPALFPNNPTRATEGSRRPHLRRHVQYDYPLTTDMAHATLSRHPHMTASPCGAALPCPVPYSMSSLLWHIPLPACIIVACHSTSPFDPLHSSFRPLQSPMQLPPGIGIHHRVGDKHLINA
ncbi:unnamed protein product [Periconia digitata]|uniref:Uncharacterized protein n=1 Tax=Periconia digitata TaxID=1303443 RepID=A0A9W4UIL8_9PLEO|nr:unnamed protein product [Periconia digitata]